ncbi:MAG: SigE family RNA polymerase sigma factor [Actinomycetes bacterium]
MENIGGDDFESFVAARSGALLRYAYVLTGDQHRAEDLVQSALASCYRHWRRIRAADAERYVRKAVLNAHLSWWRRPMRTRETSVGDVAQTADLRMADPGVDSALVIRDEIWQALTTLPPRQRAVVVLRYYEDLSENEVAARMDVAIGTVKSQHKKAMRTLELRLRQPSSTDEPELTGGTR